MLRRSRWTCRHDNSTAEWFAHRMIVYMTHAVVHILARNSAFPPVISYEKYTQWVDFMSRHGIWMHGYGDCSFVSYILMGEF